MSQISLKVLGTPEVWLDGELLSFPTRKALALFIYLALEPGMHSRDKLTAIFWPESDQSHGRSALRNNLRYLRAASPLLSEQTTGLGKRSEWPPLKIERDTLGLDPECDLALDLRAVATAARTAQTARLPPRATAARLKAAGDLYRGDFLEGFTLGDAPDFDAWVSSQREACQQSMSLILAELSQAQIEAAEFIAGIETVRRWLQLDPLNEAAYRRSMQISMASSNVEAALRAYDECRRMLATDLGREPSLETQALARRIKSQASQRMAGKPNDVDWRGAQAFPLVAIETPLVGRGSEFGKLAAAYYSVQPGRAQAVVVEGEAGIGKTRLTSEFLAWASVDGADVLQGQALETAGKLPYQPLVEALRARMERENAPDDLLSDVWLTELSRVMPELRDRYPDLPTLATATRDEEAGEARSRLFEAVARLGQALSEHVPVILFIDDAQWADAASLDLLSYLGKRWLESGAPILILLTIRSEALVTNPEIADWLMALGRNIFCERVELGPLSLAETLELVGGLTRQREHSTILNDFGEWLFQETGGQPFFLLETLKALLQAGVLVSRVTDDGEGLVEPGESIYSDSGWRSTVPAGVREVIKSRLSHLTANATGLLAAAAVLGHGFGFEIVCKVAGLADNDGLEALDELIASRLVREERDVTEEALPRKGAIVRSGGYAFSHDKIRDVVYTEAGEARRRVFHRRAFETLLDTAPAPLMPAPPASAAELALHALSAGLLAPAFVYSLRAGNEAGRVFATRDAIAHYEQARSILLEYPTEGAVPPGYSHEELEQLYTQLGRAYENIGASEKARHAYDEMLSTARSAGATAMECVALNRLATLASHDSRDYGVVRTLLGQALAAAEQNGQAEALAETEWNIAHTDFYTGQLLSGHSHGLRALSLAREIANSDLTARSLNMLGYIELGLCRWNEAEAHAREARPIYAALGDRIQESESLSLIACSLINAGKPREGIAAAREGYDLSAQIGDLLGQAQNGNHMATGLANTGEYAESLAIGQRAVEASQNIRMVPAIIFSLTALGATYRTMGLLDIALKVHLEAEDVNERMAGSFFAETVSEHLCADYAFLGEWEQARIHALQSLEARDRTTVPFWGYTRWCETEALLRGGDSGLEGRAREDTRRFGEEIKAASDRSRQQVAFLRSLSVLAKYQGVGEEEEAYLREALELALEIGLPQEVREIRATLGYN